MNNISKRKFKTYDLVIMLGYIVLFALSFISAMYKLSVEMYSLKLESGVQSLFNIIIHTGNIIATLLGIMVYASITCGIVISILIFLGKMKRSGNVVMIIINASTLLVYLMLSLYVCLSNYSRIVGTKSLNATYHYSPYIIFWIYLIILLAFNTLTIIFTIRDKKRLSQKNGANGVPMHSYSKSNNSITGMYMTNNNVYDNNKNGGYDENELRKYKELRDLDIITQEEFEEKVMKLTGIDISKNN